MKKDDILFRTFTTTDTGLSPYIPAMLLSHDHWSKRKEEKERRSRAYRKNRALRRNIFAEQGEDLSILPPKRAMIPPTRTVLDDTLIQESCIFSNERNDDADRQIIQDLGFLATSARVLRKEDRSRGGYETCDFFRIYCSNIHLGNYFASRVSNLGTMQIYPDEENDVIRGWSGMALWQKFMDKGFHLDNEHRMSPDQIRGHLRKCLGRYYKDPDALLLEYYDPFMSGVVPGQKVVLLDDAISSWNDLSMLDDFIGVSDRERFSQFISGHYMGYRGWKTWDICTPDGLIRVRTNFDRNNFTKRERKHWLEQGDYTCPYCGDKWTRDSSLYLKRIELFAKPLVKDGGFTECRALECATKYVEQQQRLNLVGILTVDHAEVLASEGKGVGLPACTPCNSKKGNKRLSTVLEAWVS